MVDARKDMEWNIDPNHNICMYPISVSLSVSMALVGITIGSTLVIVPLQPWESSGNISRSVQQCFRIYFSMFPFFNYKPFKLYHGVICFQKNHVDYYFIEWFWGLVKSVKAMT